MIKQNKIIELKKKFKSKKLSKKVFIKRTYKDYHQKLYDYSQMIKNTTIEEILIKNKEIVFKTVEGIKMYGLENDLRIVPIEMLNFNNYEKNEINIIFKIIKKVLYLQKNKKFIFFDVGANIGWYTLFMSKLNSIYPSKIHVYAFEPIKSIFKCLKRNIELNNIKKNVVSIFNIGFSNKIGSDRFYFYETGSGNSSMRNLTKDKKKLINCKLLTLDSFVKKKNIPDLIKVDIEGGEFLLIQGALKSIKDHKPIFIIEILRKWSKKFNTNPNEIFNLFKNNDYTAFTFGKRVINEFTFMNNNTLQTNFLFLHNFKHAPIIKKLKQKLN